MKIFLLQSYLGRSEKPIYPLGLAYLGASLRDHEVLAFDPNVAADPYGELAARLGRFRPDVVGISLRNVDTTQYRDAYLYLATLRPTLKIIAEHAPGARTIIGGAGFSIYAQGLMERYRELDFGILLEAEEAFPALLADLDRPEAVPGVFYRANGEVRLSGPPKLPDFDALPAPRWDVVDMAPYKGLLDAIGVQAKRGCGLKCAYCTYYFLNGAHYRLRSPEKIVAEIAELKGRFGVDTFMFVDSIFNVPPRHAEEICRELIRQKVDIPWSAWYNEHTFSEDFYRLARQAGCRHFSFSPDAFSDRSLKLLRKSLSKKDILRVYDLARREDASFGWNFFVNPPGQTYGDFARLMAFWLKVKFTLRGKLYGFGLGNIRIEPDTEIQRLAVEQGVIPGDAGLLPETEEQLRTLFYTNPETPGINVLFKLYDGLAQLKRRVKP
ncbi:MAG: radical SAM protein [Candidatus Zixiibacteriota bacterium]|nr:MAG: radical SAM protein [candidate division Zixibacteria bacterium]